MRDLLQKTIDTLKLRVKSNLKQINSNQEVIKGLLKEEKTKERNQQFDYFYNENKNLLQQNNDYINIQLSLINFMEKYKNTPVLEGDIPVIDIASIKDENELMSLTIENAIDFNEEHPKFNDAEFIDKLIRHYGSIEEYEKCQHLLDLKSKLV